MELFLFQGFLISIDLAIRYYILFALFITLTSQGQLTFPFIYKGEFKYSYLITQKGVS